MIRNFLKAHRPHKHPHEGVIMGAGYGLAASMAHSVIGSAIVAVCYFSVAIFAHFDNA